ncbi:MAG: hypothetical protein ABIJ50_03800 [Pseudomonadota bacterium]
MLKKTDWMDALEQLLGSWAVFIGEDGPTTAKITGRLYVTSHTVYFDAGIRLDRDAGLMMGAGDGEYHADVEPPFQVVHERVVIPRRMIRRVTTSRKWWLLQSLHLHIMDGTELVFRFGACSTRGAVKMLAKPVGVFP